MSTTETKAVPAGRFGRPLSQTRKSMFTPKDLVAELPLGDAGLGDAVIDCRPRRRSHVPFKPGAKR